MSRLCLTGTQVISNCAPRLLLTAPRAAAPKAPIPLRAPHSRLEAEGLGQVTKQHDGKDMSAFEERPG